MKIVALDNETDLIAPGYAAPLIVCTAVTDDSGDTLHHVIGTAFEAWRSALESNAIVANVNLQFDAATVCATWPELTDLVFDAYATNRMVCLRVAQRLLDIANGKLTPKMRYSAYALAKRYLSKERDKGVDTWRLRYSELRGLPLAEWPQDAIDYPLEDSRDAYDIAHKVLPSPLLRDAGFQSFKAFALYLQTCRGIRTDPVACQQLIEATEAEIVRCRALCERKGLLKLSSKGKLTKQLKLARERFRKSLPEDTLGRLDASIAEVKAYNAARQRSARIEVQTAYGLSDRDFRRAHKRLDRLRAKDLQHSELLQKWASYGYSKALYKAMSGLARKPQPFKAEGVRITKSGLLSVNAEACRLSGDKALQALATYTSANTLLKKAQRMAKGAYIPLQTSYETPMHTGRTSSRASEVPLVGDNFQNFRRSAMHLDDGTELPGMRECIVPRDGYLFCSIDLDSAEMRGFAQHAFEHLGWSCLRDALNAGQNPHRLLGSDILRCTYAEFDALYKAGDPEAKRAAQFAKIPNFALLGGGGWRILPDYAKGMGIVLSDGEAQHLAELFHARWREVKLMHKVYKEYIHDVFEQPVTRRLRYLDRYAQACNGQFQSRIADAAGLGVIKLAEAMYRSNGSLRGSYTVLHLHDENLIEVPKYCASEHAWRATKIMIDAANVFLSDVPMTAKPALMRRFSKGAEHVVHATKKDSDGNPLLLVWEP